MLAARGARDRSFEGEAWLDEALTAALRRQARRIWIRSVTGAVVLCVASFVVAVAARPHGDNSKSLPVRGSQQ